MTDEQYAADHIAKVVEILRKKHDERPGTLAVPYGAYLFFDVYEQILAELHAASKSLNEFPQMVPARKM